MRNTKNAFHYKTLLKVCLSWIRMEWYEKDVRVHPRGNKERAIKPDNLRERKIQCSASHPFTLKPLRTPAMLHSLKLSWDEFVSSQLHTTAFQTPSVHINKISALSVPPVLLKEQATARVPRTAALWTASADLGRVSRQQLWPLIIGKCVKSSWNKPKRSWGTQPCGSQSTPPLRSQAGPWRKARHDHRSSDPWAGWDEVWLSGRGDALL